MKTSICIPTYEMNGVGDKYLKVLLNTINNQSEKDYEIIISDHSKSDIIFNVCKNSNIKYYRNLEKIGNSSNNMNNAILHAKGEYIKIMHQDDFFYNEHALEKIKMDWGFFNFNHTDQMGTSFYRNMTPSYADEIITAKNTIGAPSVMFFKNDNNFFDDNLIWMNDCEIAYTLFHKYGEPVSISDNTYVSIRMWPNSVTNTLATTELRKKEIDYCLNKYNYKIDQNIKYKYV
jgi:glycosyltransferase involved in cell wall biosynthesis